MLADKLKGTIDQDGRLIVREPISMAPGEVEVILLQAAPAVESYAPPVTGLQSEQTKPKRPSKIKAFQGFFENTQPAPPDFDPDQARWEALKEKYDL